MVRPLRIEFAGALYHVMSRGNERREVVKDDADRRRWLDWLRRTVETYRWRLHAFVLMDNHSHLFVETPEPNLSTGMQHLNGSYTGYYNRRHRRSGHLFQGRYKAHLIESEGHYLEVSRYIHLNPVRAGLIDHPKDWRWSSYRGYHRATWELPWVTYDDVLRDFASDVGAARRGYRRFVSAGMAKPPPRPWADAVQGLIVGGEAFVDRIRWMLSDRAEDRSVPALKDLRPRPSLARIAAVVAEAFGIAPSAWAPRRRSDDNARAVAAFLSRRVHGYGPTEIARALGYTSHSGVVSAIRRIESGDSGLREIARRLDQALAND